MNDVQNLDLKPRGNGESATHGISRTGALGFKDFFMPFFQGLTSTHIEGFVMRTSRYYQHGLHGCWLQLALRDPELRLGAINLNTQSFPRAAVFGP